MASVKGVDSKIAEPALCNSVLCRHLVHYSLVYMRVVRGPRIENGTLYTYVPAQKTGTLKLGLVRMAVPTKSAYKAKTLSQIFDQINETTLALSKVFSY